MLLNHGPLPVKEKTKRVEKGIVVIRKNTLIKLIKRVED